MPSVNEMMNRAIPDIQRFAGGNKDLFEVLHNCCFVFMDDMIMLYNIGKRHRESGKNRDNRLEFVAKHPELENNRCVMPKSYYTEIADMLYTAYCDGFNGVKR